MPQVLGGIYLVWRVLRTLNPQYAYFYSIPFWCGGLYCLPAVHCLPARTWLSLPAAPCACNPQPNTHPSPLPSAHMCWLLNRAAGWRSLWRTACPSAS